MPYKIVLPTIANLTFSGYLIYTSFQSKLTYYIHQRYVSLVQIAAIFLIVFSLYYVFVLSLEKPLTTTRIWHNFKNIKKLKLFKPNLLHTLNLVFVAIGVLILTLPPKPLLAVNVDNSQNTYRPSLASKPITQKSFSKKSVISDLSIQEWSMLIQSDLSLRSYKNQKLQVTGFISNLDLKDSKSGSFLVSRYMLACCAVDATLVSLPVVFKDSENLPNLKNNDWVTVSAHLDNAAFENQNQPVLILDKLEVTTEPDSPYLYY
jgi:uncharacterized repeat protein (TIGR03943 family)